MIDISSWANAFTVIFSYIIVALFSFFAGGIYFIFKEWCVECGRTIYLRPIKIKKPLLQPSNDNYYIINKYTSYHKKCYIRKYGDAISP
jgi:hypothetical protein